jgi:hypothetical protein
MDLLGDEDIPGNTCLRCGHRDPTYHGIMFQTDYVNGQPLFPVADTVFTNVSISGARRSGVIRVTEVNPDHLPASSRMTRSGRTKTRRWGAPSILGRIG